MIVKSSPGEYITMAITTRALKNITFDKVIHDTRRKENAA